MSRQLVFLPLPLVRISYEEGYPGVPNHILLGSVANYLALLSFFDD
jgi:hypothetical protein